MAQLVRRLDNSSTWLGQGQGVSATRGALAVVVVVGVVKRPTSQQRRQRQQIEQRDWATGNTPDKSASNMTTNR